MKVRLTAMEKFVAAIIVICFILANVFGYVAVHFISKFW